jgi:hypothetical protein
MARQAAPQQQHSLGSKHTAAGPSQQRLGRSRPSGSAEGASHTPPLPDCKLKLWELEMLKGLDSLPSGQAKGTVPPALPGTQPADAHRQQQQQQQQRRRRTRRRSSGKGSSILDAVVCGGAALLEGLEDLHSGLAKGSLEVLHVGQDTLDDLDDLDELIAAAGAFPDFL